VSHSFREMNKGRSYEDVITELEARVAALEKLLVLVIPDSKYPALAEAYREYKIVEKLTIGNEQKT